MAYTATNVTTAKQGATATVSVAPAGTTLPTNATTALANAFTSLGHISEDGVTKSISRDSSDIVNMDGAPVYNVQTGITGTVQFGLLEGLNPEAMKMVYGGGNVTGTLSNGITANFTADEPAEMVVVIDTILRGNVLQRTVIPRAKVTDTGDIVYKNDEALIYDITMTAALSDAGKLWIEYTANKPSGN